MRRKVPKGMNGVRRKLDSSEYKTELVPATIVSKMQGLKRKLNSGEDYHTKPEVLQTQINTSNTVEVDSDSEVVFNVPQAKKLKTDSESTTDSGIEKDIDEPKPQLKLNIDVAKNLGHSILQGENSAKILGQTVLQGESAEEIKPRRSPNGYLLSDPLPQGLVLKDLRKKTWKLGKSIGLGGFGEIYAAALLDGKTLSEEDYVVKVEPHNNGPLFVELHFYCRATKKEDLDNFAAKKNIKHLGVPDLKGHGSFIHRKKKLRFIVMPRYGTDLQTKIDESKSCLSLESTSHLATQIIDSLEYLHSQGYVHKDLKANNMIFRRDQKGMNDKLFLVDFGLASRYLHLGIHRPFEPDQRSAHEGTLEYVSRDGHLGCVSRRGDMECLLYVIIEWLGGHLPWDTDDDERLKPTKIQEMKIKAFHDIKKFLTEDAFKNTAYPPVMEEMMTYISEMEFEEEPNYNHFRKLFRPYLPATIDNSDDVVMVENNNKENIQNKKLPADISEDDEISFKSPAVMQKNRSNKVEKRQVLPLITKRQQSVSRPWDLKEMQKYNEVKTAIIEVENTESLKNCTPQMKNALKRIELRKKGLIQSLFPRRKAGSHFGAPARRKLGMRKNSESQDHVDVSRRVQKTPMKAKDRFFEADIKNPNSVRRSPRSTVQSKIAGNGNTSLGQHLYGITASGIGAVTRLVNNIFFAPTKLRPRKQQKSG